MLEYKQGTSAKIPIRMVSLSDLYTPITGLSSPVVYYVKGGSETAVQWTSPNWQQLSAQYLPGLYVLTATTSITDTPGPLCITVSGAGCLQSTLVIQIAASIESDLTSGTLDLANWVWGASSSAAFSSGSFGRNLEVYRKLLTNGVVDGGTTFTVYDDNSVDVLGTFTWTSGTSTRSKLT